MLILFIFSFLKFLGVHVFDNADFFFFLIMLILNVMDFWGE